MIEDPSDPAWHGHVHVEGSRWHATTWARAAAVLVAFLVGMGAVALVGAGDPSDVAAARGSAQPSSPAPPAPHVTPDPTIVPPPLDQVSTADPSAVDAPAASTTAAARAPASTSGWAPAAATRDGSESGRLEGDLAGIAPALRDRLDALAARLGMKFEIVSGWRTHREQADLYRSFRAGTGNLAAVPGTSRHEIGLAADVYVNGVALASNEGATAAAKALGMHFPVPGEPWHVELIGTP